MENSNGNINAKELLRKYAEGTASEREQDLFEQWYMNLNSADHLMPDEDELTTTEKIMLADLMGKIKPVKQVSLWPRIAAVAAAVTAITLGIWLYRSSTETSSALAPALAMNDIAPGKNIATLTLASGKIIKLDTNRNSVVVTDSVATSTMLTASTPRGGTYIFTLPDGTKVCLNADSKISFPSQFSGKERKIVLEGEAYFEVAKNKTKPFIVESNGQEVTVLGTHFNINSYKDEGSVKTTLLEGSVRVATLSTFEGEKPSGQRGGKAPNSSLPTGVSPQGGESSIVLKPNQQATVIANRKIQVKNVDASEAIAWKNGEFVFESENIKSIMRKIARWYDVDIVYEGDIADKEIWGSVSRYEHVSKVLEMLSSTQTIDFELKNKTIVVKPFKK